MFLLLDDVIHAFGSVSHDNLHSSLISAGVHPSLTELIVYAVQHLTLHMGVQQGVCLFRAMYEAGMRQGDPICAHLYCFVNEIRVQPVLEYVGPTDTPGTPFRNLGWIDDSSWIGTSHNDIQHVVSRLPITSNLTNLFSVATKTVGFGTTLQGKRAAFGRQPIQFSGMPLRIPEDEEYIRLLGRRALPNVLHRQALRKLMSSCRRAIAPVSMSTLRAHYPFHMYNAVVGGIQRWSCAIHVPLPRAMCLANLPVASLLRKFWNINADSPPESFLQLVACGWSSLCSPLPTMVLSFMSTYQHQLNHPNPHVRASTRHGLL